VSCIIVCTALRLVNIKWWATHDMSQNLFFVLHLLIY